MTEDQNVPQTAGPAAPPAEGHQIPPVMPILPTGESVIFPFMVFPMLVKDERSVALVSEVARNQTLMGLFSLRDPEGEPIRENLNDVGTAGSILRLVRAPDGSLQVVVRGVARIRLDELVNTDPYLSGRVEEMREVTVETTEVEALQRNLLSLFERIVTLSANLPDAASDAAREIDSPGRLADFVASALDLDEQQKVEFLGMTDVEARLRRVTELATRELEVLELGSRIQGRIRDEMDKTQREYYLRQQLKQVQAELNEITGETSEAGELRNRIEAAGLPEAARKQADDELARLETVPAASPEYGIIRTYVDWLVSLPWSKQTEDNLDLKEARRVLDD